MAQQINFDSIDIVTNQPTQNTQTTENQPTQNTQTTENQLITFNVDNSCCCCGRTTLCCGYSGQPASPEDADDGCTFCFRWTVGFCVAFRNLIFSEFIIVWILHYLIGLISIAAVVLGSVFYNSNCYENIALGLIINGSTGIMLNIFRWLIKLGPTKGECCNILYFMHSMFAFGYCAMTIWGMVMVLPYQRGNCNNAIYIYGFIYWNLWWFVVASCFAIAIFAFIFGGLKLCCEIACGYHKEEIIVVSTVPINQLNTIIN